MEGGHYAKCGKSERERQLLYYITYMQNAKKPNSQKRSKTVITKGKHGGQTDAAEEY